MSYKRITTAGDLLRFRCCLKVDCTNCFAARTMTAIEVCNIHPGNRPLAELAARLRCRRCGRKEAKIVVLDPV